MIVSTIPLAPGPAPHSPSFTSPASPRTSTAPFKTLAHATFSWSVRIRSWSDLPDPTVRVAWRRLCRGHQHPCTTYRTNASMQLALVCVGAVVTLMRMQGKQYRL
ncbi:hypothetical protein PENSPDRAFT_308249 [Peniophora sp. CONT]|nr:hypothetical protein PENSPDRAFT_308249 [Peniophora sp. CONT]